MHVHACILYSVACLNVSAPTLLNSKAKKIKLLGYPFQIPTGPLLYQFFPSEGY